MRNQVFLLLIGAKDRAPNIKRGWGRRNYPGRIMMMRMWTVGARGPALQEQK